MAKKTGGGGSVDTHCAIVILFEKS
jgi:hypothetical protein